MQCSGLSPHAFELYVATQTKTLQYPHTCTGPPGIDYYEVLGVDTTASSDDIRKAFRHHALRWHPDKVAAEHKELATERFKELSAAYEVLSDPVRRRDYDVARAAAAAAGAPMPGHQVPLAHAWEVFIAFMVSACVRQYQLSSGPVAVVRFISTCGVAAIASMGGSSEGVALSALAAALLHGDGVLDVYRNLLPDEQVAFSNAVLVIARHVME